MDHHTLPCGTPIPAEGIRCITGETEGMPIISLIVAMSNDKVGISYGGMLHTRLDVYVPVRKDLSPETYHGEPLRSKDYPEDVYLPTSWDSSGVCVFVEGHGIKKTTWANMAEHQERYINGEWQPCYIEEGE